MVNKELIKRDIEKISNAKVKYFFIGIIVSIIPYSIILLAINNYSYGSNSLREIIIVFGILTAIINAIALPKMACDKLKDYFLLKYNMSYAESKNLKY